MNNYDQNIFTYIAPPAAGYTLFQPGATLYIPDKNEFSRDFLDNLVSSEASGPYCAFIWIYEDAISPGRELVIRNDYDVELARIAREPGYTPDWVVNKIYPNLALYPLAYQKYLAEIFDPAGICMRYTLIAGDSALVDYVDLKTQSFLLSRSFAAMQPATMGRAIPASHSVTNLMFTAIEPPTNNTVNLTIGWPDSGLPTNRIEIFTCDNLSTGAWSVADTVTIDLATNRCLWTDYTTSPRRFYHCFTLTDSDGDTITAGRERLFYGTDPELADSDDDDLRDDFELFDNFYTNSILGGPATLWTDPLAKDSDGDGLDDGEERLLGTDPWRTDSDGDTLTDYEEVNGDPATDPLDPDSDDDGLTDSEELTLGTNPLIADTDGDELSDYEEINGQPATNPLLWSSDADKLSDAQELLLGSDPFSVDTDGDGLPDDAEAVLVTSSPASWEWHTLTNSIDVFYFLPDGTTGGFVSELPLPFPVTVSGTVHTNIALSLDCYLFLLKPGEDLPSELTAAPFDLSTTSLNSPHEFIAPYWSDLLAFPTHTGSSIRMAEIAPTNGTRRCVIEYKNLCVTGNGTYADHISFQIILTDTPTNNTVTVNYNDIAPVLNGANAAVGIQRPGNQQFDRASYSYNQPGSIYSGLSLAFALNSGTNPLERDTDHDGLTDLEELNRPEPTDPRQPDTDGDGFGDGWEVANNMNPLVNNTTDGDPDNDPGADPDKDGLTNYDEYLNNTNPFKKDSDDDGINDIIEIAQGSNPMDGSDGGLPPPADDILELPFSIGGDWAAWEMTVSGISGADTRIMKLSTDAPGGSENVTLKLHKGNSYRVTMSWLGSGEHTDPYWYCWEAKIGGLPSANTFNDYSSTRLAGVAESFSGPGWFVDNRAGLLTSHVHMNDDTGGNVAGSLTAVLHVVKVELEPVTTEANAQGLIFNPCGVAVNGLATYRVVIEPATIQDEDILWSVASGGVAFYNGHDTGREVIIRGGASESDFKLEVQIGDLPETYRPYIHGRVLEPKSVQVRAYVICASNGVEAVSTATINGWITEANRIYRQVAVTFTLTSVTTVTNQDWFVISNPTEFYEMTSYANNTGGLELYCVNSINNANGQHSDMNLAYGDSRRGMAVSSGAFLQTLAHEIGHACGLSDMYKYDAGDGLVSEEKAYPLNWSGGEGTGYYSPTLAYRGLTYRVIMSASQPSVSRADIPLYYLSGMYESIRVQISVGLPTMGTREPLH